MCKLRKMRRFWNHFHHKIPMSNGLRRLKKAERHRLHFKELRRNYLLARYGENLITIRFLSLKTRDRQQLEKKIWLPRKIRIITYVPQVMLKNSTTCSKEHDAIDRHRTIIMNY